MSCVIVVTPIVIAAWPTMAASIAAAATAAGFSVLAQRKAAALEKSTEKVELEVPNSEVLEESLRADASMQVERDGVRVTFSRDARGRFRTTVEGELSKERLREIGEDLSGRVVQQYTYRRLCEELQQNGFVTVDEEYTEEESLRLHVRRMDA